MKISIRESRKCEEHEYVLKLEFVDDRMVCGFGEEQVRKIMAAGIPTYLEVGPGFGQLTFKPIVSTKVADAWSQEEADSDDDPSEFSDGDILVVRTEIGQSGTNWCVLDDQYASIVYIKVEDLPKAISAIQ